MESLGSSKENWLNIVRPGSRVFIGSGASVPRALVDRLLAVSEYLRDVEVVHIHTLGDVPWVEPKYADVLRTNTFFLTPEVGRAVLEGRADYTPCSLSEVPKLFTSTALPIDVALISVSPPDEKGKVSLGVSVDVVRAAVKSARVVVAQINSKIPRTHGESVLDVSEIDWFLKKDQALVEAPKPQIDEVRGMIGNYLAEFVEDGSTIQVGIGMTPVVALKALKNHRHLGIHSGMFCEPMMDLIQCGAVDNSRKHFMSGRSVASHALGSRKLYRFANENPEIEFRSSAWVNDPGIIAMNQKMVAVNGARQIDITGQVVRDSSGHHFHGGIGAQIDFARGAAASPGGRPVHVLPSTSSDGKESRIVISPGEGSVVASARTDVHYVITEYGVASLRGRSIRERALEMIQVAHPKFREELMEGSCRGWIPAFVSVAPTNLQPSDTESGVEFRRLELGEDSRPFFMRPLHASDIRRLQEFFYSHSEETIRNRFGYLRDSMPADSAYKLVGVDQSEDLAVGLFEERGLGGEPLLRSVGRFYRDSDGESAEVAFVVHDETRRMGMASLLFRVLASVAKKRGIKSFWAEVLPGNRPMRALFERFGGKAEKSEDGDELIYRMSVATVMRRTAGGPAAKRTRKRASSKKVAVGWHGSEDYLRHDTGPDEVETAERYRALLAALKKEAKRLDAVSLPNREATRAELLRCHAAHYLDLVHIDVEGLADRLRTGDTPICPDSEEVAKLGVGAGLEAVAAVMEDRVKRAFVAVRPPGHHATTDRGMGFCIYNNVALMARHAQEAFGVSRILIVDWDVHHGNGTQDIFFADESVFFFSAHQEGIFPHTGAAEETGAGPGMGTNMNLPLPAGSGLDAMLSGIEDQLAPAMEKFRPGLVLISAGFDARKGDPLGDLTLSDA
ncbi:MAG: GNAT family N-acetyltransferase, partial [Haloferula sp.]